MRGIEHRTDSLLLLFCGAAAGLYTLYRVLSSRKRHKLPPGPRKLPVLGNLLDIPTERQWEAYHEWSRACGSDIIHVDVLGRYIVVVESMEGVRDLFEKRSSIYSDRPPLPMVEHCGWGWAMSLMKFKYGDDWREHRKLMHASFHATAVKQFHPQISASVHVLLRRLLDVGQPEDVMAEFRLSAGCLIMDVAALRGLSEAGVPGKYLIDMFPLLKHVPDWIPGAGFQRKATAWRNVTLAMRDRPFDATLKRISSGTAMPSFVSTMSNTTPTDDIPAQRVLRNTAGIIYAGGADTSIGVLGWFVFAMLQYPDVQRAAQAELDAVLGHGVLPRFEDRDLLPYTNAVVKEVLRWRPPAPIGIPHSLMEDDEYRGYRIPKGSVVIGNVWAMLHNENTYPDSEKFAPERFLHNGQPNPHVQDPESVVFGFGRRICPGRHLALSSTWLTIASTLASLHIDKPRDGAEMS
ncbi:Cytochrome P450 [Mycena kentingensis (nom. inval.)]|nr:Cytochrome P450 [Mycena kentingensis (nom. inval.)]